AALVIALGMLVDNAIVVVENIVARMEAHQTPRQAALGAVYELAVPLFTATGTTVAAFVPMLLSKGSVGEFTRAIPILVTAVLLVSYLYAILVTPAVASWVLRPKPRPGHRQLERLAAALTSLTIRHYRRVIVLVLGALVLVGALGTF